MSAIRRYIVSLHALYRDAHAIVLVKHVAGWLNRSSDPSKALTSPAHVQMVALELFTEFKCCPVFLGADLKERYYKGTPVVLMKRVNFAI